jgi:hypothetical protein
MTSYVVPLPARWTDERLRELRSHLSLPGKGDSEGAACLIELNMALIENAEHKRQRDPDLQSSRRKWERISKLSSELANLIGKDADARLVLFPKAIAYRPEENLVGHNNNGRMTSFDVITEQLRFMAAISENYAQDDDMFFFLKRGHPRDFPDGPLINQLWRELFGLWIASHGKLSQTANGPLQRFVFFVHDVIGRPRPSTSTLRDAARSYHEPSAKLASDP